MEILSTRSDADNPIRCVAMALYEQERTCARCGHEEVRQLPPLVAAFEERRQWTAPCSQCGSHLFSSSSEELPPLDAEILEEWAAQNLHLDQQDEDLLMASPDWFPLLSEFVQRRDLSHQKRSVLLSALCVLVFDNTPNTDYPDAEIDRNIAQTVIDFLVGNRWLFEEIGNEGLYHYIAATVYPQIGRELPPDHDMI